MTKKNRWVLAAVNALEKHVGCSDAIKVLEECGRDCARSTGLVEKLRNTGAKANSANELYQALSATLGDHVALIDNELFFIYPKCYCSHIKDALPNVPHSHCNCSAGWIKEICESVSTTPVEVEILQSVIRGADSCRFKVTLS